MEAVLAVWRASGGRFGRLGGVLLPFWPFRPSQNPKRPKRPETATKCSSLKLVVKVSLSFKIRSTAYSANESMLQLISEHFVIHFSCFER